MADEDDALTQFDISKEVKFGDFDFRFYIFRGFLFLLKDLIWMIRKRISLFQR